MPFVCQLSKTRGLIVVFMVLTICRFGSSPLQKRSGNCRCSLSCAELPELMKNERVEVYVQDQSGVIYNEIHEVSSLFNEGHCSVVVLDCLQEDKKVELRIYAHNKNRPIYEKMDLKPECKTEEPTEESNKLTGGGNKTDPIKDPPENDEIKDWVKVTIGLVCVGLVVGVSVGIICWIKYSRERNMI